MLEDSNPQVSPVSSITRNNFTHEQLGIAKNSWLHWVGLKKQRTKKQRPQCSSQFIWPYLGGSVPHFQTNPYIYIYIYIHEIMLIICIYIYTYTVHIISYTILFHIVSL